MNIYYSIFKFNYFERTKRILNFPNIDPIAFHIGPLQIRWYAIAYICGFLLSWIILKVRIRTNYSKIDEKQLDLLLNSCLIGVIMGGRLGYCIFYNFNFFYTNPIEIIKVWNGGMSFHGGFLGVCLGMYYVSKNQKINFFSISDEVALVAPIGLFFGRIANFINSELYGRVTDYPIGMIFPNGGPLPRHPSQLYEALMEGLILFIVLILIAKFLKKKFVGLLSLIFLILYGFFRFIIEFFREPDSQIGFFINHEFFQITLGQFLSLPMILVGLSGILIIFSKKNP